MSAFYLIGTMVFKNFHTTIIVTMAPKRVVSKDTTWRSTREVVEKMPVDFLVYQDTQLFVEKDSDLHGTRLRKLFSKELQRRSRRLTDLHWCSRVGTT